MNIRHHLSACTLLAIAALACSPGVANSMQPPAVPSQVSASPDAQAKPPAPVATPLIQVAILLDTSNSMDGLISQAKSQVWGIVNTLASLKRGGVAPMLEVALIEYGNDSISSGEQHVRQVLPLTRDLDEVSSRLFALTTNGGNEFCGAAIEKATTGLAWSKVAEDFRVIVIAGNEPFSQGPISYKESIPAVVKAGVIVNTIFCGSLQEGETTGWKDGALLGEGRFSNIATDATAVHIESPFDAEIRLKGAELNSTYISFGGMGAAGAVKQQQQDANAAAAPAASVERSLAKSKSVYSNSSWDLVDALKDKSVKLEEIPADQLPAEMKNISPTERIAYVEKQAARRQAVQKELGSLQVKREAFLVSKRAEQAGHAATLTLEQAMNNSLYEQAIRKGFTR